MTCILRCNVLVYQQPGLSGFTFFDGDNIFWTLQTSREISLHIVETCVVISFCHCKSWIYIILIMDRYHFTCKWHQWRIMFQQHPPPPPSSLHFFDSMDVNACKGSHPAVDTFFKSHVNNETLICYRGIFFPLASSQAYMLQLIVDYYYIVTNTGLHQVTIGRSTRVDYVWNNTMWHINLQSELASLEAHLSESSPLEYYTMDALSFSILLCDSCYIPSRDYTFIPFQNRPFFLLPPIRPDYNGWS